MPNGKSQDWSNEQTPGQQRLQKDCTYVSYDPPLPMPSLCFPIPSLIPKTVPDSSFHSVMLYAPIYQQRGRPEASTCVLGILSTSAPAVQSLQRLDHHESQQHHENDNDQVCQRRPPPPPDSGEDQQGAQGREKAVDTPPVTSLKTGLRHGCPQKSR